MMNHYPRLFLAVAPITLLACLCGIMALFIIGSIVLTFQQGFSFEAITQSLSFAGLVGMVAFFIGVIPALLFGSAAYAFLLNKNANNYLTTSIVGTLPAVILAPFSIELGILFLIFSIPISLSLHFLALRSKRIQEARGSTIA
ncbi:hypothetical protein RF679_13130 [Undibacterium cyanobacteriorum]|uniref:MotA/TolQ/ExbB proton channel domain-containing protein n=1 Tax=Undibacterium cyanobacteriorum TaxID=3073561 RepID=A0ABY9REI1_9BURK|nr:hypothetical protein [Undibacterium sp. 20NA77.5]WMW79589.1 hypothetical protein RF679_13130 [Undibacterium sp. 20NA77.5]